MKRQIFNLLLLIISISSFGQSFTVTINTTFDYCNFGNGTATAIPSDTCTSGYTYFWSNGETTQTIVDLAGGSYSVTVTCDTNTASASANVLFSNNPTCEIINIHNDTNGQGSGSMTANVMVYSTFPIPWIYTWNTVPTQTAQTAINLHAGTYTVTVDDSYGCSCTCSGTITNTSAINEVNNDINIFVYPNPTNDFFSIDFSNSNKNDFSIELTDLIGEIVMTKKITDKKMTIDISTLPQGLYYLKIYNKQTILNKKILKE